MTRSYMPNVFPTIGFINYYFNQVLEYQKSGIKLGVYKSINESITRVAVYVSLLALYILGGNKVKAVSNTSHSCFYLILLEVVTCWVTSQKCAVKMGLHRNTFVQIFNFFDKSNIIILNKNSLSDYMRLKKITIKL